MYIGCSALSSIIIAFFINAQVIVQLNAMNTLFDRLEHSQMRFVKQVVDELAEKGFCKLSVDSDDDLSDDDLSISAEIHRAGSIDNDISDSIVPSFSLSSPLLNLHREKISTLSLPVELCSSTSTTDIHQSPTSIESLSSIYAPSWPPQDVRRDFRSRARTLWRSLQGKCVQSRVACITVDSAATPQMVQTT